MFPGAWGDEQRIRDTITALSTHGSRLAGYDGDRFAADLIERELIAAGVENVMREPYDVVVPMDHGASLELESPHPGSFGTPRRRFELQSLWPNLVRTNTLGPDGLEGDLIYGGSGQYGDFDGKEVEGSIVLMEFNSGRNWRNAAALGAAAVIFIEPEKTTRIESFAKWSWTPVHLPRFWLDRSSADLLRDALRSGSLPVRLDARMEWESHTTWNIWGVVSGADPALADELVVVQSYYDGSSVVPADNPAAESAAGIAALLEFARYLREHPPGRSVALLATGSHFQGRSGLFEFFDRHARALEPFRSRMPQRVVIDSVDVGRLKRESSKRGLSLDSLGVSLRETVSTGAALDSVDMEKLIAQVKLRRLKPDSLGIPLEPDSLDISLFIALDLSSNSDQVGLMHSAQAPGLNRIFVPLGRSFTRYAERAAAELGRDSGGIVNLISPIKGLTRDTYIHLDAYREAARIARDVGIMALSFITTADARLNIDSPLDTADELDFANIRAQSEMINMALHAALGDADLFGPNAKRNRLSHEKNVKDGRVAIDGRLRLLPKRGATPVDPVPHGIVVVINHFLQNRWRPAVYIADEAGDYQAGGLERSKTEVRGFLLDEDTGDIIYATDMGDRAQAVGKVKQTIGEAETPWTTILFPCEGMEIHERIHANFHWTMGNWTGGITVLDKRGTKPRQFGWVLGDWDAQMMVLFSLPGDSLRLVEDSLLLLNNAGATDEVSGQGRGFDLSARKMLRQSSLQSVRDIWRLDEIRMERMREYAIENPRLLALHESAERSLQLAERAREELAWGRYAKHIREALGYEYRAYPDVRGTQNDVVNGLAFFVALLIPAAFFAERLVFASADIRRQLFLFGAIMLAVWMALANVHPAFGLAHPIIVLIALVVMVTAFFVIALIVGRFNGFMTELKQSRSGTTTGDLSRTGTAYVAFMLGISNMRRRALRTCLTLGTITVLTFTVLSFTSIKPQLKFIGFEKDWTPAYSGVLLHDVHWWPFEPTHLDYLRSHFGDQGTVVPRSWLTMGWKEEGFIPIRKGVREAQALGLLGMTSDETAITAIDKVVTAGRWLGGAGAEEDGILLSGYLASQLGVSPEDLDGDSAQVEVSVFGKPWKVIGIFDEVEFERIRDLNNEPLTPAKQRFEQLDLPGMDHLLESSNLFWWENVEISYEHLQASRLAILPYDRLREMGAELRSIAVKFDEGVDARTLTESYLTRAYFRLFVGMPDDEGKMKTYAYMSLGITGMEGFSVLIVPISIAALIVLNTMLGSVYERFREIGVYSSVGLAPVHIAFLFVAEACVYGVLGVTIGYVVGQAGGKLLLSHDMLGGISLNYSSTAAIASAVLVMAVVVASTLYPARVASRLAVPDVVRRWQLPQPEGDVWQFSFPFTASAQAVESLCGYLHSYFSSYGHESVGKMYTEKTRIVMEEGERGPTYVVQLLLWLAPFDMGVSEYLHFNLAPTPNRDVYGIQLYIERISGPVAFWERLNQHFMLELRKQFLVWQTLKPELQAAHRDHTKAMISHG